MTECFLKDWKTVLDALFYKASLDLEFRQFCVDHPRRAAAAIIAELDLPDFALPEHFKFAFVTEERDVVYSYVLSPHVTLPSERDVARIVEHDVATLINWATCYVHPTTQQ